MVMVNGDPLTDLQVDPIELTITDDDERGVIAEPEELTLAPGDPASTYSVQLNSEPTAVVTVELALSSDEYVTVSPRALTFTASTWDTPQQVEVTARPNAPANEVVTIGNAASGGDYDGESAAVTITIFDPPTVMIDDEQAREDANEVVFEVSLTAAVSDRQVTVEYRTEDGTATSGEAGDYLASKGTLTFAAGDTRATIRVQVMDDTLDETRRDLYGCGSAIPKMPSWRPPPSPSQARSSMTTPLLLSRSMMRVPGRARGRSRSG